MNGDFALGQMVGEAIERLRTTQNEMAGLSVWARGAEAWRHEAEAWKAQMEQRMSAIETASKAAPGALVQTVAFLTALYSPRQWGLIVLVLVASAANIVTPQEVRALVKGTLQQALSSGAASP